MPETERLYNELNEELHRELPKFYNYRIDFIASNLSRLYSTESTFHSETGKVSIHVIQNPRFFCGLLTNIHDGKHKQNIVSVFKLKKV